MFLSRSSSFHGAILVILVTCIVLGAGAYSLRNAPAKPVRLDSDEVRWLAPAGAGRFIVRNGKSPWYRELDAQTIALIDRTLEEARVPISSGVHVRILPKLEAPYPIGRDTETAGFPVVVVNVGDRERAFFSDSAAIRLFHEAKNEHGEWQTLSGDPNTYCGVGHETLRLNPGERWILVAPLYRGGMVTQLRFRLEPDVGAPIYSKPYVEKVDPAQFR